MVKEFIHLHTGRIKSSGKIILYNYIMIEKLNRDDILTLMDFLGRYIEDKDKLIQIIEGLEEILSVPLV